MKHSAPSRGFTLVELLIGMSLAGMVLFAVISSFLYLGRNLTRLINQQTLEAESRRTLAYFAQDVRMASALSSPTNSGFSVTLSTGTISYSYNATAGTLTRTLNGIPLIIHRNLTSLSFRYFDGNTRPYDNGTPPYTTTADYQSSIKQVSLLLTAQAGDQTKGTRTALNTVASARYVLRNKETLQ